jgi:diguanylate cyclase (GGDEF)-like protein
MERGTVVVAEDSRAVRRLISDALAPYGLTVLTAADGRAALECCATSNPDVVLLDVEMPELDGFATLAALHAMPGLDRVPVLFLTGRTDVDDVVRALDRGAHDYVRKPFDAAELLARVSAALRLKRLEDELRLATARADALARTDSLTGLANRRELDRVLSTLTARDAPHAAGGLPGCAAILVDVDHFKAINDAHGHLAGDAVLREIGRRLRARLAGEGEAIGRWGGEEFLVVLPQADMTAALRSAERLRSAIASAPVHAPGAGPLHVTVSCGVALSGGGSTDALLREADAALYAAKDAGRNTVCHVGAAA